MYIVTKGNLIILNHKNNEDHPFVCYLKMNNYVPLKTINSNLFIRNRKSKTTSYLYFNDIEDNGVYCLSFFNQNPGKVQF